jgi:hypothetical protein
MKIYECLQIDGNWKEIDQKDIDSFLSYGCQVRGRSVEEPISDRTTRMIEKAMKYASQGEDVWIVFPSTGIAKHWFDKVISKNLGASINRSALKITYINNGTLRFADTACFDNGGFYIGRNRTFIDHSVSEQEGIKIR